MEPKFQTSFIPKKPIVSESGSGIKVIRSTNIFSVVATVLFIVVIIISAGLFAYKTVLQGQITDAKKSIDAASGALQPEKIKELIDANSRIMATKNLLDKHIAVSKLLLLLQDLTVKRMRISELTYKNVDGSPTLSIKTEVQTYNALAQQEVIFSQNEFLKSPEFSNFNLTDNGNVIADFNTKFDPSLISYKKAIESMPLNQ